MGGVGSSEIKVNSTWKSCFIVWILHGLKMGCFLLLPLKKTKNKKKKTTHFKKKKKKNLNASKIDFTMIKWCHLFSFFLFSFIFLVTFPPLLEKCKFSRNVVKFPTISYVFLYPKSQNFFRMTFPNYICFQTMSFLKAIVKSI